LLCLQAKQHQEQLALPQAGEGLSCRFCLASGRLGQRLADRRVRGGQRIAAVLRRQPDAFGTDDFDLGDAQETEQ
jgi:hypothetical protein